MKLHDIIYEWVEQNFGQSEADDPSWNIEALADHLSRSDIDPDELSAGTKSRVYADLDQHYVEEDVQACAADRGITLTPQQVHDVADRIRYSDWYMGIPREDMDYYIDKELEGE